MIAPFSFPCPGTFRVLLLRKRGNVVSAAAMRTFGTKFAGGVLRWAGRAGSRLLSQNLQAGVASWAACGLAATAAAVVAPADCTAPAIKGVPGGLPMQRCRLWPPRRATVGRATAAD